MATRTLLSWGGALLLSIGSGSVTMAQTLKPRPLPVLPSPTSLATPRADIGIVRQQGLYVLGPGDRVKIDIFNVPEFSGEQQVLLDGSLTVPLVGTVIVRGLTLQQASEEIGFRMAAFLERPIVNVGLTAARPLRIAVAGEVNRPGAYTAGVAASTAPAGITAPNVTQGLNAPTVSQLLQAAGGITQLADVRRIQLRRPQVGGATQNFSVNLWSLLQTGDLQQDLALFDGDSIFVPTVASFNLDEAKTLASANFSPTQITINIVGEVARPGRINMPANASFNEGILAAGGFTPKADSAVVELLRLNPNGSVVRKTIAADFAQGLNNQANPSLQNNDVILIRRTGIAEAADSLNVITQPLLGLRSLIGIFDLFR